MSALSIQLHWQRAEAELKTSAYSNAHSVQYNDRYEMPVDAAPDWGGDPANTNPEQALASALSSCHMMTFLAKNPKGQMSVTQIDLHPVVRFDTGFVADNATLADMQDRAHRYCFIANTLADSVAVNIL
jgi:organic hydroperoxide reductase OsmC/OhrA